MLNVLLKVAVGVAAAYGISQIAAGSKSISTEEELEAVLRLHSDWIFTEHIPTGQRSLFVTAPDGSVCLARMVNGDVRYYKVSEALVRRLYGQ